jgi:hypothetical protein
MGALVMMDTSRLESILGDQLELARLVEAQARARVRAQDELELQLELVAAGYILEV